MILQKLIINNFRQFKGKQTIEFSFCSNLGIKNVTVVFGKNGRGKTGVFRAILFCLFGDQYLTQDGDISDKELLKELQLINATALEQCEGKPVETYVELQFTHKDKKYTLRRVMNGLRMGSDIHKEVTEVKLIEFLSDGNTKIILDPALIDSIINSILDKRVKEYFLFDGEKIERLTRASADQRKEIRKGIRNLLNVDALEIARKVTDKLTKTLEEELKKNASPELGKILSRLENNEQSKQDKTQRLEEIGEETIKAQSEISQVDKELDAIKDIRGLLDKRKSLEQTFQQLEHQDREYLSGMKSKTVKAASLLIAPTISNVFEYIENQKRKGDIPSEIRKDLIEKILSDKRCICGNIICEGSEAHNLILKWLHRTADVTTQDAALNLWRHLSDIQNRLEDNFNQIENDLIAYSNNHNDIIRIQEKINDLRQQIGSSERKDASALDEHRRLIEEKIIKQEAESRILQSEIDRLEKEHIQLTALYKEEKQKANKHIEVTKRASLARETRDALDEVYEEFTKEIKDLIGEKATDIFSQILDPESRENLRTVVVDKHFSLQVLDRWNRPFLANISAGQRQILSISFIAALAQVASKNSLLEMPLFMDTPFGRLSYEHRQNLINRVPEFSSQWILLATDTEFRKQEARLLRQGNRWGKFYILRASEDGNTVIEERNIDDAQAMLRAEENDL